MSVLLTHNILLRILCAFLASISVACGSSVQECQTFSMVHNGNATNGQTLFNNGQRLGCARCHSIDGHTSKVGPDLFAIGDKLPRQELIRAILEPSASIAVGYATTIIDTIDGEQFAGIIKNSTADAVELAQADGSRIQIAVKRIKGRRGSAVSLMPEGLQSSLSLQEFTDLIDYLTTLRQPENSLASDRGMPESIPELTPPVPLVPFLKHNIRFPASFVPTPGEVRNGLVWFAQIPGTTNQYLVVNETGRIWRIEKNGTNDVKTLFLDISKEVFNERGPNGLVCLAFHPNFRVNHKYHLECQLFEEGKIETAVVERRASPDFLADSGQPSRLLWKVATTTEAHTGGCIAFGPDGFLYIGMGDTGPQEDPQGHGQDLKTELGKMLRIDVDHQDPVLAYAIPRDNPFVGRVDARPEIWAYGIREPWRFSFDSLTGELWVGDVGQDRVEEVSIIERGKNYGWNVYEGFEPFSNHYRRAGETYVPPVFAYRRKFGASVIGGYVYRGDKKSSFYGVYICGDYVSRRIFGVKAKNGKLESVRQLGVSPQAMASFARDEQGEIYVVGYKGMVYHLDLAGSAFPN